MNDKPTMTAKVKLGSKVPFPSSPGYTQLSFYPDYDDDRNKEWAIYTPALNYVMNVRTEVADRLPDHGTATVTFEFDEVPK